MTNTLLKTALSKIVYLDFQNGVHPDSDGNNIPGNLIFLFDNNGIYDGGDLNERLLKDSAETKLQIDISPTTATETTLTFSVVGHNQITETVNNIKFDYYKFKYFLEKENGRNVNLLIEHKPDLTSLEKTKIFMGIAHDKKIGQPITIHSWTGTSLGA